MDQATNLRKGIAFRTQLLIDELIRHGINETEKGESLYDLTLSDLEREVQFLREVKGVVINV